MKKTFFLTSLIFAFLSILVGCGGKGNSDEVETNTAKSATQNNDEVKNEPKEKLPEKAEIGLYVRNGSLFDSPCLSKILVSTKDGKTNAIHIDCENEYGIFDYFKGDLSDLKVSGKGFSFDNCGGGDPSKTMCKYDKTFKLEFTDDSTKVKLNGSKYNRSKTRVSLKYNKVKLFNDASLDAEVFDDFKAGKAKVELLEIGDLTKKGSEWDIWFKVKIDEKEGWCLGCINF